ncbi:hypothetical protein HNP46_007066 [Pseudomonas nitritireducens]|uniref:Uncharacterized protein n=1 Tax=Pseudomonas nitroreducens TaxID=46680 RepID=A0A7W7P4Z1_PSENT|nr:hypothetical protein [Pseudomonas nitritireducens]MBB4868146.1 hypothetical protein [Pseudomonas nitritireducens]
MHFIDSLDAVRGAERLALNNELPYAIYSEGNGFSVSVLIQPNGAELEIINPVREIPAGAISQQI